MKKTIDLKNDPIKKLFSYYLFSSVLGIVIKSIHIMLDGIFVSNGVGAEALAAISIYSPILIATIAVTSCIGMGGSTLASIRFGEGNEKSAQNIFIVSIFLTFLAGLFFSILFLASPTFISKLLGANETIIHMTIEYGKQMSYFLPFYTLFTGLAIFIRNDKNPTLSMIAMIVSAIINIILNYIFIFIYDMGLSGAAIATGISQIAGLAILTLHFVRKSGFFKLNFRGFSIKNGETKRVINIGLPTFISEFSYAVVSILFNIIIINIGGELAVSAFTIMIYVTTLLYNIYYGMGHGMQPIISYNYGSKNTDRVYESFHLAILSGFISAIVISIICSIFIKEIVMLFNRDNLELIEMAIEANRYVFYSMPFVAYNILVSIFFQSVGKSREASSIMTLRGVVFLFILVILLSKTLGLFGIWLVYPISEVLSFGVCIFFMKKQDIFNKMY